MTSAVLLPMRNAMAAGRHQWQVTLLRSTVMNSCRAMTTTTTTDHSTVLTTPESSTPTRSASASLRSFSSSSSNSDSARFFQTGTSDHNSSRAAVGNSRSTPGSLAFADMERDAVIDLFHQFAVPLGGKLDLQAIKELLKSVGEVPREITLQRLFNRADINGDGVIDLEEFLKSADDILCGAPARIVLVVGGPGSGKGMLCKRLQDECHVVHLSSGELLRDEVARDTLLGREVKEIMDRGELVSSAVIVTLIRRRMRDHPGKRVLLDGFPRSLENAHDLVKLCGRPEVALHLTCDDTILMERIIKRGRNGLIDGDARADDNFDTALQRLRTFHKYHHSTMEWLREQRVPVVNLDCSGPAEDVWSQLMAIGRLMRPATQLRLHDDVLVDEQQQQNQQQQPQQQPQQHHDDAIFGASTG